MPEQMYALTGDQMRRLGSMLEWYEGGAPSRHSKPQSRAAPEMNRRRLARTTTLNDETYPTPASGANTFWVELIDGDYDLETGEQVSTFEAKKPAVKLLAHSRHNVYFPENERVEIDQFNGKWWIDRYAPQPVYGASFRVSLTEIAVGGIIKPMADVYRDPASDGLPDGIFFGSEGLEFTKSGSYLTGFSMSLWSNSAPRGGLLAVGLYLGKPGATGDDLTATSYTAVRTQDIEQDQYGSNILTTLENVANCGPLKIRKGHTLTLRNASQYPIFATPCTLWAALLMEHEVLDD